MISDPFIEQLVELCQAHPTRAKWIFVPHQGLRWTLAERLLTEHCSWVNLRLVTPFSLALDARAPDLIAEGIHPCPESLGPSLVLTLLQDSPGQHFSRVADLPGTAEALWRTLMELRLAGLGCDDLGRLPASPRRDELIGLLRAYEQHLREQRLADRADILRAPVHPSPLGAADLVLVYPYHRWSRLEWLWIKACPSQPLQARAPQAAELGPGWLERQPSSPPPPPAPHFFRALRRQEEVDTVVARVLQAPIALDQVEIVAADGDEDIVAERLAGAALACTLEAGWGAGRTRPGQALQRLLQWLESQCNAYPLLELLREGLLQAAPDSTQAAYLLEMARISRGRHTYGSQLQALERRASQGSASLQADIAAFSTWIQDLLRRFPPEDSEAMVSASRWLSGLQETLQRDLRVANPQLALVRQALVAMLEELKQLPGDRRPLQQLMQQIRHRLERLRVQASRPRPGAVHVARPESLGLSGRDHLFWIGLEDGRTRRAEVPDCVLKDAERQQLSPWLPLAQQRDMDFQQHLRDRLATRRGQLTLSYARLDESGEQLQSPAWTLFELARQSHPGLSSMEELDEMLGATRGPELPPGASPEALGECFPWLQRAQRARQARCSPWFTAHDGLVTEAAGRWDPRRTGQALSVSRLQALATCPFQFFLEHGLGLQPPLLEPPLPDQWLDPATRGTLLHEVFALYHRHLRSRGWRPQAERDRDFLQTLLHQQLETLRQQQPPPSPTVEKTERRRLQQDIDRFLQLELQSEQRQPLAFEVGFGLGPDPEEVLGSQDPVEIRLSERLSLKLRGRIDRIDRLAHGFAVVDYKTGRKLYTAHPSARLDRGRLLQHALYGLVAERLLEQQGMSGKVVESSYYFPTRSAAVPWVTLEPIEPEQLARVLEWVLEPLARGAFWHTHEVEKDCRFCHYRAACESQDPQAIRAKLENPQEPHAQARRWLLEER